jgi:hypothetical protein
MAWRGQAWAGNRHSDKEKFCNDLNEVKTPKMSERPLKTLKDFPTSKLNTSAVTSSDVVRLAGSQDYATKMGRVEICSVEIKSRPGGRLTG